MDKMKKKETLKSTVSVPLNPKNYMSFRKLTCEQLKEVLGLHDIDDSFTILFKVGVDYLNGDVISPKSDRNGVRVSGNITDAFASIANNPLYRYIPIMDLLSRVLSLGREEYCRHFFNTYTSYAKADIDGKIKILQTYRSLPKLQDYHKLKQTANSSDNPLAVINLNGNYTLFLCFFMRDVMYHFKEKLLILSKDERQYITTSKYVCKGTFGTFKKDFDKEPSLVIHSTNLSKNEIMLSDKNLKCETLFFQFDPRNLHLSAIKNLPSIEIEVIFGDYNKYKFDLPAVHSFATSDLIKGVEYGNAILDDNSPVFLDFCSPVLVDNRLAHLSNVDYAVTINTISNVGGVENKDAFRGVVIFDDKGFSVIKIYEIFGFAFKGGCIDVDILDNVNSVVKFTYQNLQFNPCSDTDACTTIISTSVSNNNTKKNVLLCLEDEVLVRLHCCRVNDPCNAIMHKKNIYNILEFCRGGESSVKAGYSSLNDVFVEHSNVYPLVSLANNYVQASTRIDRSTFISLKKKHDTSIPDLYVSEDNFMCKKKTFSRRSVKKSGVSFTLPLKKKILKRDLYVNKDFTKQYDDNARPPDISCYAPLPQASEEEMENFFDNVPSPFLYEPVSPGNLDTDEL